MTETCIGGEALALKTGAGHRRLNGRVLLQHLETKNSAWQLQNRASLDGDSAAIVQLQAAEQAAQELARIKSEFLCLAAHDLCQPLQSLEFVVEEIGRAAQPSSGSQVPLSQISQLAAQAEFSLARMRELLRMLLEISRLESATVQVHSEPVPVAEVFEYLRRQFSPVAQAKALDFRVEPSPHVIDTDPMLLRGLLANLVANALRYTPAGEVRLQSSVDVNGCLNLAVRDTGIGIPKSEFATIFEDFRRLSESERLAGEGFGLGLGLVRRLSHLLEMPVSVESAVGRGSIFAVEVPSVRVFAAA